jgi:hypothetical protein
MAQSLIPIWFGQDAWANYRAILMGEGPGVTSQVPVARMMWVSLVSALTIAFGKIIISLLSAFAIVYFEFPFRKAVFWAIFVTLMLPVEVRIYPTYKAVSDLGLLDTYSGLTLPLIASATGTLLFRQFFMTVPDEFDAEDLRRYSRSGELAAGLVEPGREPFGAMRYLLAARIHEFLREGEPLVAAHYLLRAAWCARAEGHGLVERAALRELLLRLSNVLEQRESIASSTLPRLLYLAGETARRTGDFGRAVDSFAQVEKEVDFDDAEGLQLAHLARRQGQLASVQSDVNASLPAEWPGRRRADADEDDDLELDDEDEVELDDVKELAEEDWSEFTYGVGDDDEF